MLCEVCAALDFGVLRNPRGEDDDPGDLPTQEHHKTSAALHAAAEGGCELCVLFAGCVSGTRGDGEYSQGPFHVYFTFEECAEPYASVPMAWQGLTFSDGNEAEEFELVLVSGTAPYLLNIPPDKRPNFGRWRSWLDECVTSHMSCPISEATRLPTRVLDLRDFPSDARVSLMETHGMRGQYVTLSHVWGNKATIITTPGNYQRHCNGISIDELPLTFADSVRVASELGFDYLWIDTLCIIQGDDLDWRRESSRMASVYAYSALTIAAAAAADSWSGLLSRVGEKDVRPSCTIELSGGSEPYSPALISISAPLKATPMSGAPETFLLLYTRGWAMQERLLSKCTLGFGKHGIAYFECDQVQCADSSQYPIYPKDYHLGAGCRYKLNNPELGQPTDEPTYSLARENWYAIVDEYSSCSLTEGRDRLPAISGVARYLSQYMKGPYVAGLWEDDLAFGLTWTHYPDSRQSGPQRTSRPPRFPPPSWSWAALEKSVAWGWKSWNVLPTFDLREPCTTESARPLCVWCREIWIPCINIDNIDILLLDEMNPFGEVTRGTLTISGKLRALQRASASSNDRAEYMGQTSSPASCRVIETYFDAEEQQADRTRELYALLVGLDLIGTNDIIVWSLILEESPPGSNSFRRIGVSKDAVREYATTEERKIAEPLEGEYRTITLI